MSETPSVQDGDVPSMRKVEARIRDLIREGRFQQGDFITEAQVANDLQLSRTPVREAFILLQAVGLLQLIPHRGAFLKPMSDSEMADLTAAREMIETYVATRLVTLLSDQALDDLTSEMADLAAALEHAVAAERWAEAEQLDAAFHRLPLEAFGNTVLLKMYSELFDRQLPARLIRIKAFSATTERPGYEEHGEIWSALAARDSERAVELMIAHAQRTAAAAGYS